MPSITIDSIRENPWNAVEQDVPPDADCYLLQVAMNAANYCETSECGFMLAAINGGYAPADAMDDDRPHETIRSRFCKAGDRLSRLHERLHRAPV